MQTFQVFKTWKV